ncbi:MAG: hypothetical protein K2I22_08775 [Lachnospiraceae bacterium]|nr:hypothetical protein [Lachnospiraceae bacterium]
MKKINAVITLLLLGGILLGLAVADICTPDRLFSEYENRILASKPDFSLKDLFDGSYTEDYETYVTDQFVERDRWIFIKTMTDVLLGKKEINGVYLAKDKTLIEKHVPEDIKPEVVAQRLALLQRLVEWQEGRENGALHIMLVPTADNILTDMLPDHAAYYEQQELLEQVQETAGSCAIDVTDSLQSHREEYIYYGTDHHWTTRGAYYGYLAWAETVGVTPVSYDVLTVSSDFLGTLHSKTNLPVKPDTMEAYLPVVLREAQGSSTSDGGVMQVFYDFSEESRDSLYEEKYLETKNKYGYFLDDNHPFIRIETGAQDPAAKGKKLFVIKDSYANCFIPFLTEHYETIYVLDLRYYKAPLFSLLEECSEEGNLDILVLYNVIHFIEEFQYY